MGILRERAEQEVKAAERKERAEQKKVEKREADERAEVIAPVLAYLTEWSGHVVNVEDLTPVPGAVTPEWRLTIDGFHLLVRHYKIGGEVTLRQMSDTGETPQAERRIRKPADLLDAWSEAVLTPPMPTNPGRASM